jgi:hypothetical protein
MNTDQQEDNWQKSDYDEPPVNWTADEYINTDKGWMWYALFVVIVLGLAAAGYFLMHAITFSVLVVVMAAAVIVFSRRPPRTIQYTLSGKQGLYIGEKLYKFADFKAFGLLHEDGHNSIMLIPIKRFSPGVSVYFPEEAGEQIVDILGARLPMKELKLDFMDIIIRRLRL